MTDIEKKVFGDDKDEVVTNVMTWLTNIAGYMATNKYPVWVQDYENLQLFMGRRYIELVKANLAWMSNKKYPLISSAYKTFSGLLRKLDVNKVRAASYVGEKYTKYAENYETFVRYVFNRPETKEALFQVVDEGLLTGNAYAEVTWKEEEKKILTKIKQEADGTSSGKYETIKRAYPIIKYLSVFDVFEDIVSPKSRLVGKKSYLSRIQIETELKLTFSDEKWKEFQDSSPIFSYNYNRCKDIGAWETQIMEKCGETVYAQLKGQRVNYKNLPNQMDWYNINTKNKVFEVIEAYSEGETETQKVLLINGKYVSHGPTKLAFPGAPIVKLKFLTIPGAMWGQGLGEMGRPYQDMADTLWNSYMTAQRVVSAPMFTKEKSLGQKTNGQQVFNYRPFGIEEVTAGTNNNGFDILKIINTQDVTGNLQAIQNLEAKFDKEMGLNAYTSGGNSGVERSAQGVREKKAVTENKIACYLDNINLFISDLAEKCALLMKAHGADIETDMPDKDGTLKTITVDELYNAYKITFDSDEILGTNDEKTQKLLQTLQYAQPYAADPGTGESLVDNKEIMRKIFENAGISDIIPTAEEKLKDLQDDMQYLAQKQQIMGEGAGQGDKPKESMNFSISLKDIEMVQDPSVKQQLYAQIGVQWEPPQASQAQSNPFASQTAPILPQ